MSDIPLRPRTSTEIVDAAFQVFRREPMQFIAGVSLIYVPWLVIRLLLGLDQSIVPTPTQAVLAIVGGIVVYTFAGGVTTILAADVYLDRPTDIGRSVRSVAERVVPLVLSMLVASVFIFVGFIFLLIPGFYAAARFFGVSQAVLIEGASTEQALARSSALSVDTKRHILNTLLLVGLLVGAINLGGALVVTMFSSRIAQITLATALSAVLYPFFGITATLLYFDMRIRKEGFDVEYLAAMSSGGSASATPVSSS